MVIVTATEKETQNKVILRAFKTRHWKQTTTTTTGMAKTKATTTTEAVATIRKWENKKGFQLHQKEQTTTTTIVTR